MKRYLKLYQSFWKTSIMAEVQYRGSFFLLLLMNFAWALVYIALYAVIFKHIDGIGDWTYERSLILAATFLLVHTLNKFLFRQNLKKFAQLVYYGDLDMILTKPISSQFYVSLRQLYLRPFIRFILAWAVLLVVIVKSNISISSTSFIIYLFLLLVSSIIIYSLWFISCCSVFWLGNIENIYELFHPVLRTTGLPYDLFPGILKQIVFFVIPLVFIATIPAKSLFGLVAWPTIFYGVFIAFFLLFLSHRLWHFALKSYSSASS